MTTKVDHEALKNLYKEALREEKRLPSSKFSHGYEYGIKTTLRFLGYTEDELDAMLQEVKKE